MSFTRTRREVKDYDKHLKSEPKGCAFCKIADGNEDPLQETKSFFVIKNIFPYSVWDNQSVAEHLMIVPKRHIDSLSLLTQAEQSEFLKLTFKYEKEGYNVYARAPGSIIKSVTHQHTHLIKPTGDRIKFMLFIRRPYWRIKR